MMNNKFAFSLLGVSLAALTGCGHYPAYLTSQRDIEHTAASEYFIRDIGLSDGDIPALARFKKLSVIDFSQGFCDDEKLIALAQVGFADLDCVVTSDPHVTDKGLMALARSSSLTALELNGTSISDKSLVLMAAMPKLQIVCVMACTNVTFNGLLALARSSSIKDLDFSCKNLTQADLVQIVNVSTCPRRLDIDEPLPVGLDTPELRKIAEAKKIEIYVFHPGGSISPL